MKKIIILIFVLYSCQSNTGCLSEKNAIIIAEKEFKNTFGEEMESFEPFTLKSLNDSIWLITGTKIYDLGGVPSLKINKNTCVVSEISHGK